MAQRVAVIVRHRQAKSQNRFYTGLRPLARDFMSDQTVDCPLCNSTSINEGLHLPAETAYHTCMWCCNPCCHGYIHQPGLVSAAWLYTDAILEELPADVMRAVQARVYQRR